MTPQRVIETNERTDSGRKAKPMRPKSSPRPGNALKLVPNEAILHALHILVSQEFASRIGGFLGAERTHFRQSPPSGALGGTHNRPLWAPSAGPALIVWAKPGAVEICPLTRGCRAFDSAERDGEYRGLGAGLSEPMNRRVALLDRAKTRSGAELRARWAFDQDSAIDIG